MSIASAKKIYEFFGYHDIIFSCCFFTNDYMKKVVISKMETTTHYTADHLRDLTKMLAPS